MFVAPICVGSLASLRDLGLRVGEDEPNVVFWVLFLYEEVLLSVLCEEPALALDDDAVIEHKVWSVLRGFFWFHIGDNQFLKRKPHPFRGEVFCDSLFQTRSEPVFESDLSCR
jgi:hypothetical protein